MREVVHRAMEPFAAAQLDISGPSVELAPPRTLALSLALHELATNAAKYGALSTPDGRVEVQWTAASGYLRFKWHESRGPHVAPPVHRGFGTRLLEDSLSREFEGGTKLEYLPEGVRCEFTLAF